MIVMKPPHPRWLVTVWQSSWLVHGYSVQVASSDIIEEQTGYRPTWGGPERAPEHERSGSA